MGETLRQRRDELSDLEEKALEVYSVKSDIATATSEIAVGAVVSLLEKVETCFEQVLENQSKTKFFDEGLGKSIKEAIAQLGKFKDAKIEIKNEVTVDTKPFQSIASEIASQNNSLIEALKNQPKNDNSELNRQIIQLITSQTSLIEAALNKPDNSEMLNKILQKLSEEKKGYTMKTTKDTMTGGFITTFKPE